MRRIWFYLSSKNKYSLAHVVGAVEARAPELIPRIEVSEEPNPKPGDIVVFSFNTFMAPEVFRMVERLHDDVVKLAGGPHPSARPDQCLEHGFDIILIGEGERVVPEVLRELVHGEEPEERPGVYLGEGEPRPAPRVEDLDRFPPYSESFRIFCPLEITRGCPWGCAFCQVTRLFGPKPRHRSVEDITRWVKRGVERYGHTFARFVAPDALAYGSPDGIRLRPDRVENLLRSLRSIEGLEKVFFGSFPAELRPDSIAKGDAIELIAHYADNERVNIGAQSGSERVLRRIKRGHTVEDVEVAVEKALEVGLKPVVDFIFGLPGETEEDQLASVELARWIIKRGGEVRLHYFMPLPGTPLENEEPAPLSSKIRRILGRWTQKGKAEGAWGHQMRLSKTAMRVLSG
ncbi:TIGR04013 family B12-binding domain/radical SAM domain-containing protein [Methanopyrus sp.]